jgi:hypothetical protein
MKLVDMSRTKKGEYLKAKSYELETSSKKEIRELYRGISDCWNGYQPRTNIVKNEKGDLVADSQVFWLGGGILTFSC